MISTSIEASGRGLLLSLAHAGALLGSLVLVGAISCAVPRADTWRTTLAAVVDPVVVVRDDLARDCRRAPASPRIDAACAAAQAAFAALWELESAAQDAIDAYEALSDEEPEARAVLLGSVKHAFERAREAASNAQNAARLAREAMR